MAMSHRAQKYELNIEAHKCNKPYVSFPAATANQLIGWCIRQVRRGQSLQQRCFTVCLSRVQLGSGLVNFRCSTCRLYLTALEPTARSFVLCYSKILTTINNMLVYYKGWMTNPARGLIFKCQIKYKVKTNKYQSHS